mgnify:CR=1 FL=1
MTIPSEALVRERVETGKATPKFDYSNTVKGQSRPQTRKLGSENYSGM